MGSVCCRAGQDRTKQRGAKEADDRKKKREKKVQKVCESCPLIMILEDSSVFTLLRLKQFVLARHAVRWSRALLFLFLFLTFSCHSYPHVVLFLFSLLIFFPFVSSFLVTYPSVSHVVVSWH